MTLSIYVGAVGNALGTVNGFYGHKLLQKHWQDHPTQPGIWTENWAGWFQYEGYSTPERSAQNNAYSVARFFAAGGTGMNYYMFHGGTNFNRTSSYLVTTTYDYNAPIDEFGYPREPKYTHLKNLHNTLNSISETLLYSNSRPQPEHLSKYLVLYSFHKLEFETISFLCNDNDTNADAIRFFTKVLHVPPYTCLILKGFDVIFNTSAINITPTRTVMKQFASFSEFQWWQEPLPQDSSSKYNVPIIKAPYPYESLSLSLDSSDYTWYSRHVTISSSGSQDCLFKFESLADFAHIFINGQYCNSTSFYIPNSPGKINGTGNYERNTTCKLEKGAYQVHILSTAWGLIKLESEINENMNHEQKGIWNRVYVDGSDVTKGSWLMQTGLVGEWLKVYGEGGASVEWQKSTAGLNRPYTTWYKLKFNYTQSTQQPVVIRFGGMNKGLAWVNGKGIGRYWCVKAKSEESWDPITQINMGYTQEYYHIPIAWLKNGDNEIVLFEELNGNPLQITLANVVYHS